MSKQSQEKPKVKELTEEELEALYRRIEANKLTKEDADLIKFKFFKLLGHKILVGFSKNQMNYFLFIILAIFYSLAKNFQIP